MHVSGQYPSFLETDVPSLNHSFSTAGPLAGAHSLESTESVAVADVVAPASFSASQSDPTSLASLVPSYSLDVAVVAVFGMEVAAVVAAAEVGIGQST